MSTKARIVASADTDGATRSAEVIGAARAGSTLDSTQPSADPMKNRRRRGRIA